jgi:drug/metabolite transporter (DMT)-like permease
MSRNRQRGAGQPLKLGRVERKDRIDLFGAVSLTGFALLLAFNQVIIKVTNGGLQPVFFAGLRSAGAAVCVLLWLRYRGIPLRGSRSVALAGVITGTIFAFEFLFLFMALDLTTVSRTSVIFYSMPVWMAIASHFILPGDRLTPKKWFGLALCVAGVALAMSDRHGGTASLAGDLAALGAAMGWAATAMMAKASPLKLARPEVQLFWQVAVSAPILLLLAPLFGDLVRDLQWVHLAGLLFQIVVVVSAGFIFWLWLLSIYPASGVASFSFLSPVFGVGLGWALLSEPVGLPLIGALVMVAAGIVLINWR